MDNAKSTDATEVKDVGVSIFVLWKEYENIAMHFNELIIQLRVRALGGVAAISTLVGFFAKGNSPAEYRWGVVSIVFGLLCFAWVAIWFLDRFYYDRLLAGSVRAILELEKLSKKRTHVEAINISHRIEEAVAGDLSGLQRESFWSGRNWFYIVVMLMLLVGAGFSTYKLYT